MSVQHGDSHEQHCIIYLKFAEKVDLNVLITHTKKVTEVMVVLMSLIAVIISQRIHI